MATPPAHLTLGRAAGQFVAVAGAYLLVSLIGVELVVQPEQLSVFWPGGGLVLGYLLVSDRRHWPSALAAVFAGNAAGNLAHGHTLAVSCGFAAVNAGEPLLCAWLLARFRPGRFALDRTRDVGWLFGVPAVACAATALVGAGVVTVGLGAPYWSVWKVWWLADALGVILFAPLVIVWADPIRLPPRWRLRAVEAVGLVGVLVAVTWAVFVSGASRRFPLLTLPFPVFPLLLLVALRAGLRGTAVAVAATVGVATWGTVNGLGPVGVLALPAADAVLIAQGFAAVVALSSLVLSTALHERGEREREVGELNRVLAERVRESERAATALRESERRFQAIFHAQFQFIGLMAPDGTLLEANRTALTAAGVAEADVLGKPFWETGWWTHDAAQQDRLRAATATAAAGERVRFEASHPTADGERMWVDFSLTPFRDDAGRVALLIPEGRDITARKAAEAALAANEVLLRQFVRHAPTAIAMLDRDMRYLQVSDRWVTDYHLTGQELVGRSHYEVFPDIPDRWKEVHRRVLGGAVEACEEDPFPRADGGMEWLQWECQPWRAADGTVGGLIMFTQVITARKVAETALRTSEERYRSVVEVLAEGIVLQDAGGRIVAFNDRAGQILGLTRDRLTGRTSHDPDWRAVREDGTPFPGDEHPAMVALRTGRPVFDVLMGVERATREQVWLSINAIPFGDTTRQVVASFHDVTEARRLNARLLDSLREKDVMLREIHHRVKNNLAVVASLFHLQSGYTSDEPILRLLREAQDRVRSMALVHEHLYNSDDLGAVNLSEYTRSLVEQLFRSYRLPGPAIALAFDIAPVTLGIDQAVPCGLILNELVSNALKHAFPERGGTLTVALRADADGCELRVADDGVGIPAGLLEGKPRSLGLRLIRTLARQLNGTADFRPSAPGTDVRLRFPVTPADPAAPRS